MSRHIQHIYGASSRVEPQAKNDAARAALRRIWLEFNQGFTQAEVNEWKHTTWFPSIRTEAVIRDTRPTLPNKLVEWCEPQIVVHLPDWDKKAELIPHIDASEEGRRYDYIVGVALTKQNAKNGGVRLWTDDGLVVCPELDPGDIIWIGSDTKHSSYLNQSAKPRIMIYWRAFEKKSKAKS